MKTTLLMLLACPVIAIAMNNGSSSGDNSPSPLVSRVQSSTSLAMEEYESQTKSGTGNRYMRLKGRPTRNIAKHYCHSAVKKSVIGTTGVGVLILAGIGAWALYGTFSEQVGEMKASCQTCSEKLQNTSETLSQAQALIAQLANAAPALMRLENMMNALQPLIPLFNVCRTDAPHVLSAAAALCAGGCPNG